MVDKNFIFLLVALALVCGVQSGSGNKIFMKDICVVHSMIDVVNGQIAEQQNTTEGLIKRVSELEGQLAEKQNTAEGLTKRVSELEVQSADKDSRIATIEAQSANKDRRIATIEGQLAEQHNTTAILLKRMSELEARSADKDSRIATIEEKMTEKNGVIEALRANVSELEAKKSKVIGFSAQTASVPVSVSDSWQRVRYTTIISNFGYGYDTTTGIFSCPVRGVYFFSYSLRGDDLRGDQDENHFYVYGTLKLNSITKSRFLCNHEDPSKATEADMQCGNTVLVECPAHGEVRVEGRGSISPNEIESSFTGILLHQL